MSENQKAPGRGSPPSTPRWVKVFVIVFVILLLLVIILHLIGFGFGSHRISEAINPLVLNIFNYT